MTTQEIEQAVIDNEKLVFFVINKHFPALRGDEDIIQVGRIGLWEACVDYDSSKSKLSTFAVSRIFFSIKTELNKRAKQQRFGDVLSLDEPQYFDEDGDAVVLANLIQDKRNDYCAIDYDISFLKKKLSAKDFEIFRLSVEGFTSAEIARLFGCTRSWTSAVIRKAQAICREVMPMS